jgi:thiol-disulfide isomerase/thioredoxin
MNARPVLLAILWISLGIFAASPAGNTRMDHLASKLAPLDRATTWLNSPPLRIADLAGKVVLVDFWTYTCINWRRTVPWLRHWADKYRDAGLIIVGVHTPEFGFEHVVENIRREAAEQNVTYPIVIDSNYAIWNAFENQYWPALYFIDAQGRIRHRQFGEGGYAQLEKVIQQLLAEAGHRSAKPESAPPEGQGAEAAADWKNLQSPETYLGRNRSESFHFAQRTSSRLGPNQWTLEGDWTRTSEYAALNDAPGKVAYRFHARDVHVVMGPGGEGTPVRYRVMIDGMPPGASHGVDVDAEGNGRIDGPRMYQLIRQPGSIEDRLIEIEFLEPGVQVYVFTFG